LRARGGALRGREPFLFPGTNSHFFTGNALETEMLRQPGTGWLYEKTAFVMPLPNAAGQCGERLTPIYRLYNNLFATHRFTPSSDARARLIAAGWRDEGIGFCAYAAFPIRTSLASLQPNLVRGVQSWADCHVPTILGGCIGVFNVPVPSVRYPGPSSPEFDIRTGVPPNPSGYEAFAVPASSPAAAASDVFVQSVPFGSFAAMHLSTLSKGPSPWSSMAMVATAEGPPPKYPFRIRAGTAYELTIGLDMKLQRLEAAAGSHAYGNALLEFVDSKSGRAIRFNLLAFGTLPGGDGAGVDVKDGVTIVGTTFRPGSAFGRSTAASVRATSSSYRASTDGLDRFEYKIVRPEFAAILAAARKVDPALSAEPDDYFVLRFGILLEVYGEGEIGGFFIPAQFSVQPL
jgi:hypothetical protein